MALTPHPSDARYFTTRREAREAASVGDRVVRLGVFAAGSFGCYPKVRYTAGGHVRESSSRLVTVWMVTARR